MSYSAATVAACAVITGSRGAEAEGQNLPFRRTNMVGTADGRRLLFLAGCTLCWWQEIQGGNDVQPVRDSWGEGENK